MEHQIAFIQALRGGRKMRKRMFDTIEQRHTQGFVSGRMGMGLYEDFLSAVRVSGVSVLKAMTIIRPETVVRWHRAGFRR